MSGGAARETWCSAAAGSQAALCPGAAQPRAGSRDSPCTQEFNLSIGAEGIGQPWLAAWRTRTSQAGWGWGRVH